MDVKSVAELVRRGLQDSDAIAAATKEEDPDPSVETILVRTQGNVRYIVTVEKAFGDVTTESSATE
jgi:hypothetical protein